MKCRIAPGTASLLRLASLCLLPWRAPSVAWAAEAAGQSDTVVVQSPDGRLEIELFTRAASGAPSQLQYRVSLSDRAVVDASNLGVRLKEATELGRDCVVVGHESIQIDSSFEQYPGKRRAEPSYPRVPSAPSARRSRRHGSQRGSAWMISTVISPHRLLAAEHAPFSWCAGFHSKDRPGALTGSSARCRHRYGTHGSSAIPLCHRVRLAVRSCGTSRRSARHQRA